MTEVTLELLRRGGFIGALDEHFARSMGRLTGERDTRVLVAAALASRNVMNGHVCLDLPRLMALPVALERAGVVLTRRDWPSAMEWYALLPGSPLVGTGAEPTPLVLDEGGRLYLWRYWDHERRLAAAIRERVTSVEPVEDESVLAEGLDRLFVVAPGGPLSPDVAAEAVARQRAAAENAVRRRFAVVSGGPGTGKTSTVVKILALLVEQALAAGGEAPRLSLCAPTGKAAARLSESIASARDALDCHVEVRARIPSAATTIHRLLGVTRSSATEFVHRRDNPLATDVVLVDEASMVDLALMARLFDAAPSGARVVLLGDRDQLASVEAGAVLGDICNTGRSSAEGTDPGAPIAASIAHLSHSFRYGDESGIGHLARAVNAQRADEALAILDDPRYPDVERRDPGDGRHLPPALVAQAVNGFRPTLAGGSAAERLRALDRFRILCAHRHGRFGVEPVNALVTEALADARLVPEGADGHYAGRPILVTRNDYQVRLFNGDVGVVLPADGGGFRAHFPDAELGVRDVAVSRLPPHETVFAMSVHKSQGSEMDEIAVLLPDQMSAVLSRELLYTAITRARKRVVVYASEAIVASAIGHEVERASGLRDLLWK